MSKASKNHHKEIIADDHEDLGHGRNYDETESAKVVEEDPKAEEVVRVLGFGDLTDTILRFTIEQVGASTDKEVYRKVVEKHVTEILAECKSLHVKA